jgi:hypothetical protein
MKSLLTSVALFCLISSLHGEVSEVRGSVFVTGLNGALKVKLSLARVYVLSEDSLVRMWEQNQLAVERLFAEAREKQIELHTQKVNAYNALVNDLDKRRIEQEEQIARLEQRIAALRSDSASTDTEINSAIDQRNASVRQYEQLKEEGAKLSTMRPTTDLLATPKSPARDAVVEAVFQPPIGLDYATRTDADGNFSIKVSGNSKVALLIVTKEPNPKLKWLLRLDKMKPDGDKYLFTNENDIWSTDPARAIELHSTAEQVEFKRR